jgi:hypothetical protein
MGENREISPDHANIRMRNDAAPSIDHEGDTVIADFCRCQHVLDGIEIDLGDSDGAVAPCDGQGNVGLRLLPEIDRAHVALVGAGLGELGVLTKVRLAPELVQGKPRAPDLLPAVGIDIADLGDGRDLPKSRKKSKRRGSRLPAGTVPVAQPTWPSTALIK